jgi:hypothetical protein
MLFTTPILVFCLNVSEKQGSHGDLLLPLQLTACCSCMQTNELLLSCFRGLSQGKLPCAWSRHVHCAETEIEPPKKPKVTVSPFSPATSGCTGHNLCNSLTLNLKKEPDCLYVLQRPDFTLCSVLQRPDTTFLSSPAQARHHIVFCPAEARYYFVSALQRPDTTLFSALQRPDTTLCIALQRLDITLCPVLQRPDFTLLSDIQKG